MEKKETFTVDEGYFFGLGFFETIAVKKGRPLLLDWHLERLVDSCRFLGITFPYSAAAVEKLLAEKNCPENGVLKIVASEENILFLTRENHYGPADYEKGFHLAYTKVRRNETSPLTYRKSLNYGDCILEKRAVRGSDIQEPVFLNTRGEIAEGATSNLFFVKDGTLHTPEISSGILPGILRRWVLETGKKEGLPVVERRIRPEEVKSFEECFVTNSLLGIMPVSALEDVKFQSRNITEGWMERYEKAVVQHS
ncbi:aminotransferase class IV [Blautia sp. OF03-15BH]|uniref:aminotransferase class IV n=1 Tax=Blautia sp. OF03-15BH TaxID=2292287 RepID=UPI001314CA82|nr:aminotransferase class IV [Blautia sp. OF03-15BH]